MQQSAPAWQERSTQRHFIAAGWLNSNVQKIVQQITIIHVSWQDHEAVMWLVAFGEEPHTMAHSERMWLASKDKRMKNVAAATISRDDKQFRRRLETALSGDVRGVPVAVILMLIAGVAAGGVAALTTHVFDRSEPVRLVAPPHR